MFAFARPTDREVQDQRQGDHWLRTAAAVLVDTTRGASAAAPAADSGAERLHAGHAFLADSHRRFSPPFWPRCLVCTLLIRSSIADPYYVGLDALWLVDASGRIVRTAPRQIRADPPVVNDKDARVPANLACSERRPAGLDSDRVEPASGSRPWLAPLANSLSPGEVNILEVALDSPVTLAAIVVHNYSKTPARGVAEVEIWLDGCIAYAARLGSGVSVLPMAPSPIVSDELISPVALWNERRCVAPGDAAPDTAAAGVLANMAKRPTTALLRNSWAGTSLA